jgi:hypothetical protein
MSTQIELYCDKTFTVYKDLTFKDQSLDIEKSKVVNTTELIRVLPTWTSTKVKIRKGTHAYDAEVLTWPTIRQFIKQRVIKVISGDFNDDEPTEPRVAKPTKTAKAQQALEDLVPGN